MCFFFSSRRRHTRFDCDWSSDVCSSDLYFRAGYRDGLGRIHRLEVLREADLRLRRKTHQAIELYVEKMPSREYRSEEHTSELQTQSNFVCRLLLLKKILVSSYLIELIYA